MEDRDRCPMCKCFLSYENWTNENSGEEENVWCSNKRCNWKEPIQEYT